MSSTTGHHGQLISEIEQQRDLLRRKQERDQHVLNALYNISLACRERPSLRTILERIHEELGQIFSFDACYLALCEDQGEEVFRAALMVDEGQANYIEGHPYGGLTGTIVRERRPLLFQDLVAEQHQQGIKTIVRFGNRTRYARAWLGVPLMVGNEAIGAISIQSYSAGLYDEADRDLLQRIANVLAVAVENVILIEGQNQLSSALEQQVSARTEELAAMSEIAAALVLRRPLGDLLDRALAVALTLLRLDAGNVRLLDESGQNLMLVAQNGFSAAYSLLTARSQLVASPIRSVVAENRPQVIPRDWLSYYLGTNLPIQIFPALDSALSVPLTINTNVIGTLSLFGYSARAFSQHEIDLAQAIANQIAIVVENTRLIEEHERQIGELHALGVISRAASTARDIETVLHKVHDALVSFIQLDIFSMVIYDPEREVVTDGIGIDRGKIHTIWRGQKPPADSLTGTILAHRRPIRFADVPAEIEAAGLHQVYLIGTERPSRSWLGVPLLDRDGRALGVITVQSYTPNLFGPRDETFLESVASQVVLHVQNVALLTQLARQVAELDVIGHIGQLATASTDATEILQGAYESLIELTDASVFFLLVLDPDTQLVSETIFIEQGVTIDPQLKGQPVREGSLSGWVLRQREPLLFQDLDTQREEIQARGLAPHSIGPPYPVRSWLGVPLLTRDGAMLGVLSLQDYRPFRYDAQAVNFLSQVASHISLGVQKVRLLEERERQVRANVALANAAHEHAEAAERQASRLERVHRIASVVSSQLDVHEILAFAAREIVELFNSDHTGTVLFDDDTRQGTCVAEYPDHAAVGLKFGYDDNQMMIGLRQTRRPVVIENTNLDPRIEILRPTFRDLGITSLVIIPLISRDYIIGSISLDSYGAIRSYSAEDEELMMTVASAIAAAVENARLFAAEQDARRTADMLREMARAISSTFNPQEVLRLILAELRKVIAYDTSTLMLVDGDMLRVAASQGWSSENDPRGSLYPIVGSWAGRVARSGRPELIADITLDETWLRNDHTTHIRSWLGVPLSARGRVLGVLNIDSNALAHFSERDVEVAMTFADHAAVALENAQLYQESVTRVEQEMTIARHIQNNLFPHTLPKSPDLNIAARCIAARETGGDFYDVLELSPTRIAVIVGDVSGKSLPAAMVMAVARSTARAEVRNHEVPWVVLSETNRSLTDDVPRGTFVALAYAMIDTEHQRLALASGGQLAPMRRHADGTVEYLDIEGETLPLGIRADVNYGQTDIALAPGDTLLFYTDGIVEARNRSHELFSFERLEALFAHHGHLPPDEFIALVLAEVSRFSTSMPQHDDMTLVVVQVK